MVTLDVAYAEGPPDTIGDFTYTDTDRALDSEQLFAEALADIHAEYPDNLTSVAFCNNHQLVIRVFA